MGVDAHERCQRDSNVIDQPRVESPAAESPAKAPLFPESRKDRWAPRAWSIDPVLFRDLRDRRDRRDWRDLCDRSGQLDHGGL